MADKGHEETEEVLKRLEKEISKEYAKAEKEIAEKLDDYLRRFKIKDEIKRKAVENGIITEEEYQKWRVGQIAIGERWAEMRDSIAQDLTNAAQISKSIAMGYMPEVYAINHNYGTYQVEQASLVDTSYTLYDRHSAQRLFDSRNTLYHKAGKKVTQAINEGKQMAWDKKQVQSVMLQGLLQGESIGKLATRLSNTVGESDRKASIRNARTMATGVQNSGRVDSYKRAEDMGIDLMQEWLATLDGRTRHEHRVLDGQRVPVGEKFEVDGLKIEYPGDPTAEARLIYNCRCTLVPVLKGFEVDSKDLSLRNTNHMEEETYEEWKANHPSYSDPITKQDEIEETMKRAYGAEYRNYATSDDKYNKLNDPLLDVMGPIEESHPEELERFLKYAESRNVEVKLDSDAIAYGPGLKKGQPGQLHVSKSDSYGAWLHEMQHLYDDEADGWMGFGGLFDIERRTQMEYNAYKQEINLAKSIGRQDIVDSLIDACKEEIEKIGGVWDESKLQ